ncbi:MAG TPA: CPBP family intramembrane glutamic endopeptidase [Candidatus Saccharimonadales bacterium]|jgi:membrane protease YdiL (CAAX protease family)|nr:CPBP family intramembrane glutamic endopeptidase [Candidatus Saccharimonadales bacterium]
MSNDSSSSTKEPSLSQDITWGALTAILVVIVTYVVVQLIGAQATLLYPIFKHWSNSHATSWFNNSPIAQFSYSVLAEGGSFFVIWGFIHWRKSTLKAIGLVRAKFKDITYALLGVVIYFPVYIIVVEALSALIPSFNVGQTQQIGFSQSATGLSLFLAFVSLVIIPPIAEEVMFRGFLYSGLKRNLPKIWAVLLTSLIFASPHLLESAQGGILWIAGVDTFILSLVLIYLREKTGRLYASMGLHALKNFAAFASLFLIHTR